MNVPTLPENYSVPGSILVAGEYFITQPGGQGLAVAVAPKARMRIEPADSFQVTGRWPGGSIEWKESDLSESTTEKMSRMNMADSVFQALVDLRSEKVSESERLFPLPKKRLNLDTCSFFRNDGSKAGFGSSAAAAVLLSRGYLSGLARDEQSPSKGINRDRIARLALSAHLIFQDGRGSGYDIMTSCYGGCGIFTGGEQPEWNPVSWPENIEAWIIQGRDSVDSRKAVSRFQSWCTSNQEQADEYRNLSKKLMKKLLITLSPQSTREATGKTDGEIGKFISTLNQLSDLGRKLGNSIGVPADTNLPEELNSLEKLSAESKIAVKCLGAGNELILIAGLQKNFASPVVTYLNSSIRKNKAWKLVIEKCGLTEEAAG